jgi:D-alanine transaminase
MSRIAYVNGQYVPHQNAAVHIEDRGYQFADGIYEVCEVRDGCLIDETRHLARLNRSLNELEITPPVTHESLRVILRRTIKLNRVRDGMVYIQITRGVARRDHIFPSPETPSSLVVTARMNDRSKAEALAAKGIAVITVPDNRWERVDIKSISLLPNVIARQRAKEQGAKEAWFVDKAGYVTEGAATNAWIITHAGELVTRPAESGILRGITRTTLLDLAQELQLKVVERPFTVEEAKGAAEAFISAATTLIMPVVMLDGHTIGNGKPGPVATRLRAQFHSVAESLA